MRLGALGAAPLAATPAFAQEGDFPSRPIRIMLAFAPGGGTDLIARTLAQAMQGVLGQPVVVGEPAGRRRQHRDRGGATSRRTATPS